MPNNLLFSANSTDLEIEAVEKKGIGHPDALADAVSEELSGVISNYFLNKYRKIPRFNVDMVSIIGGDVELELGSGEVKRKAALDIAGNIPYLNNREIEEIRFASECAIYSYLTRILSFRAEDLFQINWRVNYYSTRNTNFFHGDDSQGNNPPLAEDTVVAYGFAPHSTLEQLALDTENHLCDLGRDQPIGSDTKLMLIRNDMLRRIDLIASIGFKALQVSDYQQYLTEKRKVLDQLQEFIVPKIQNNTTISTIINAADDETKKKGYFLLSGSAAEHDKGVTGKGNSLSGVISPFRFHSFESVFGKNPVYHAGKIYNVLAFLLAKKISDWIQDRVEIVIVSQLGAPISSPKVINVNTTKKLSTQTHKQASDLIAHEMDRYFLEGSSHPLIMRITEEILERGNLTQFRV